MKNKTKNAYDRWAENYDNDKNPHTTIEHKYVLKAIDAKPHEVILDAACGTGKYTVEFFSKGATVYGIDISPKMINVAKSKNNKIHYQIVDIKKKLEYPSKYFNKINCAQAIKHIPTYNLKKLFKEYSRIIKDDGVIVFSVTHPDMDWTDFETKTKVTVDLRQESNIFHHKFKDYFDAFKYAGLTIADIIQVPIGNEIKSMLTNRSYRIVKGRYEVIVFKLKKAA